MIWIILITASLCASCSPCLMPVQSFVQDSVARQVVIRDTIVRDTAIYKLPYLHDSVIVTSDTSHLENRFATSTAIVDSIGRLHHTLESRTQQIAIPTEHKVEIRDSIIYRERRVQDIVYQEVELSAWQQFRLYGFYLLLALWCVRLLLLKK